MSFTDSEGGDRDRLIAGFEIHIDAMIDVAQLREDDVTPTNAGAMTVPMSEVPQLIWNELHRDAN